MDNNTFHIRVYGRTELALLYSPCLTPKSAWRKLAQWITLSPRLRHALCTPQGTLPTAPRTFTPRQVAIIVEELGEP